MFETIVFTFIGILTVVCVVGFIYYDLIEPIRAKLALAEHFPMYETDRNTYIENSKIIDKKNAKVQKLKGSIDRLEEEAKYLTGADLLIVKGAIERLKIEYAEVNADYKLSKMTFESYTEMFYTLYPFAYPCDKLSQDIPLTKKEILYKNIKNSLDK